MKIAKLRYLIRKDLVYISGRHGCEKDVTVHVVQDGPLCGGHHAQLQVGRVQKEVDDKRKEVSAVSWASGRCGHMIKCLWAFTILTANNIVLTITNSRSKAVVAVHKLLAARMLR